MLAAARKTDFGGDAVFGSQAMDTFRQLQDEHFADVTADSGMLGLATIIEAQMARYLPADTATATQRGKAKGSAKGADLMYLAKSGAAAARAAPDLTAPHTDKPPQTEQHRVRN